jgi:hypothetical protein
MIQRRPTQHVKDQNWFDVALDFLIVVMGVFMALQLQLQLQKAGIYMKAYPKVANIFAFTLFGILYSHRCSVISRFVKNQ